MLRTTTLVIHASLPSRLGCFYSLALMWLCNLQAASVSLYFDQQIPQIDFAAQDIRSSFEQNGYMVRLAPLDRFSESPEGLSVILTTLSDAEALDQLKRTGSEVSENLRPEGFSLRKMMSGKNGRLWVIGADFAGVMYGGLELAELIRIGGIAKVADRDHSPYLPLRGTKFNCPLDVRTPSYSDVSDSAQQNIGTMWDFAFWKEYIDNLARHRFNFISLWSLHPFPSLVKVPKYEEIALADIQRSTVKWREYYSLRGLGFDDPEILDSVEVLKQLTMEEKIAFWRKVMSYAKDRNVAFLLITWNIFVNGTAGKYGITDHIGNSVTQDYFRRSVKELFRTYPDLKGIGLTTGENMPEATTAEKEDWAFKTYGLGVLDAAQEQPGRKITFVHRQHQTGAAEIAGRFQPLLDHPDIDFIFSFKYAKAHALSSTRQTFHQAFVDEIRGREGLKTIWTLRNDDVYHFRWGAPDFVRDFIRNIPYGVSHGFYYGSDQYIWGREFLSLEPEEPRQLEVQKHWYHWMLWGRLGYDPELPNTRFVEILQKRFPEVSAQDLFDAWQEASMIYPLVTGFHWGALDFQWYIEACKSRPDPAETETGFHDVNRFITLAPHPGTNNVSIPDYVATVASGKEVSGTAPPAVAQAIHDKADRALRIVETLNFGKNRELRMILADIRSMALLGKYYAHKIQGATELALYRMITDPSYQQDAARNLTEAAKFWEQYTASASASYKNPLWTNRVGFVDWRKLTYEVLKDIRIALQAKE